MPQRRDTSYLPRCKPRHLAAVVAAPGRLRGSDDDQRRER